MYEPVAKSEMLVMKYLRANEGLKLSYLGRALGSTPHLIPNPLLALLCSVSLE